MYIFYKIKALISLLHSSFLKLLNQIRNNKGKTLISVLSISFLVILDQITKVFAKTSLKDSDSLPYLFNTFWLTYAENTGAFLSLGSSLSESLRFAIFSILVSGILLITFVHLVMHLKDTVYASALCLILAGGIGNLIDRVFFGFVTDFLFFKIWILRTGIFNAADVYIVLGVVALIFHSLVLEKKGERLSSTQTQSS